jgi:hypothetical protein
MTQVHNEILEDNHSTCSSDDNTIYIVLHNLQNILEYHELIEKKVWVKNMKSYVHNYLKNNSPSYEDFIKIPKYLIDAPFEVPNTNESNRTDDSDDSSSYDEENYDIIVEDYISIDDDNIIELMKEISYYIISIDLPNTELSDDEKEKQAFDDFMACEQQYEQGLSSIARFCSKLVLLSYAGAYLLMFSTLFVNSNLPSLLQNDKNNTSQIIDYEL